jgi:hypothetical protein
MLQKNNMHRIKIEPQRFADGTCYSVDGDVVHVTTCMNSALQHVLEYMGKKCTLVYTCLGEDVCESQMEDAAHTILIDADASDNNAYFLDDHFVIKSNNFDEIVLSMLQKLGVHAICETRYAK